MTKTSRSVPATEGVAGVQARLAAWRAQRKHGEKIPEELWEAAARLARRDGVGATSAALRLSYYDLRRRMEKRCVGQGRPASGPVFVEMAATPQGSDSAGAAIEIARPDGTRMWLRLGPLVEAMLRAGS